MGDLRRLVDADARQEPQEVADVLGAPVPKLIIRDDVLDVGRKAALIEGNCLRTHLPIGHDGKIGKFHGLVFRPQAEFDVSRHRAAGGHHERDGLRGKAKIADAETRGARGKVGEPEDAVIVCHRLLPGGFNGHDRIAQRHAARGVEHPAGHGASHTLRPHVGLGAGENQREVDDEPKPAGEGNAQGGAERIWRVHEGCWLSEVLGS